MVVILEIKFLFAYIVRLCSLNVYGICFSLCVSVGIVVVVYAVCCNLMCLLILISVTSLVSLGINKVIYLDLQKHTQSARQSWNSCAVAH